MEGAVDETRVSESLLASPAVGPGQAHATLPILPFLRKPRAVGDPFQVYNYRILRLGQIVCPGH